MQRLSFDLSIKKEELIRTIKENKINITNKFLVRELIYDGSLDSIINKISQSGITVFKSPLNKEGHLTGYEQFISLLDNFITYVLNHVNSPSLIKDIIVNCIKNNEDIFLSKKYFYDVSNTEQFLFEFNVMIVKNFYNNLLKMSDDLVEELDIININITKINIDNREDVLYLVNIIDELVFINRNNYKILGLFIKINKEKYNLYVDYYKMLIDKYKKNKNFIIEYRKFKDSNYI